MKSRSSALDLTGLDDNALAVELCRGVDEAFKIVFDRYAGVVLRIARRIVGDRAEAEDVLQQVFLEVYREIRTFDSSKGSFKFWLCKRAQHRAIDRKRHLSARGRVESIARYAETHAVSSLRAMGGMAPQEIVQLTEELLGSLPARQQAVIRLHYFQGLTLREIELQTKNSEAATRHWLYDGIKIIRTLARHHCDPAAAKLTAGKDGNIAIPRTI